MGAVVFVLVMDLVFLIMGILLFLGKCSWLIAGYNTASDEEKAQYDEKKLCKVMGITCLIISILLCVMAYLVYKVEIGVMDENKMLPFAVIFIIIVLCTVSFDIYYSNKKCKK